MKSELDGQWILVTGASSGLGRAMCRRLARDHGANLLVTARRAEPLDDLATELPASCGVDVTPVVADLTEPAGLDTVVRACTDDHAIRGAILNAGITYYGRHDAIDPTTVDAIIQTNVHAITTLTLRLLPTLDGGSGRAGRLMLVSSMAGSIPLPYQAVYSASKAYVTAFGRALQAERPRGPASITVYAPGGIATEMLDSSGLSAKFSPKGMGIMPVEKAAEAGLRAFVRRKRFVVPGLANKVSHAAAHLLPRRVISAFLRKAYEPPK